MKIALSCEVNMFIEASVLEEGLKEFIENSSNAKIKICPSATLIFHPGIMLIFDLIKKKTIGDISNVILRSGQYLPYWHKYEKVSDYYVSKPETGGAREIVPFELTWLMKLIGKPLSVYCMFRKTIEIIGAPLIDDTYNILLGFDKSLAVISIDVVSRNATRSLEIVGSEGHLKWNWENNFYRCTL